MKHVIFNKILIQNFLSVGSKALELDLNNNINVITGRNLDKEDSKNGVGKSTITDAIHFALYGSPIREITKDQTVNSTTGKNCKVELTFCIKEQNKNNTYVITRTISPTKCNIFKDGDDVTLSTIAKTNEFILSLINCSSNVFKNSVVMSLNNTVPFMAQSKVDKRKYIENILQLEMFSQMLLKAREDYNSAKTEFEIKRGKNNLNINNLSNIEKQIELFEQEQSTAITKLTDQIKDKKTALNQFERDLIDIENVKIEKRDFTNEKKTLRTKLKDVQEKNTTLENKKTTIATEKKILSEQFKQLQDKNKPCPTCLRPFEDHSKNCDSLISDLRDKINLLDTTEILEKISKNKKISNQIEKALEDIEEKEENFNKAEREKEYKKTSLTTKIEFTKNNIEELSTTLDEKRNSSNESLLKLKKEASQALEESSKNLDDAERALEILDCVKYVLSEEGVKTFLIKKILNVLNTKINYYLAALHAPVKCTFNEFFEEVITDENNSERSYFNFSGGERKRIDLACLFAFMDMKRLQGETVFNTTFYDELLDSSLDDKGVDMVISLLSERKKKYNEGSYIITHRQQSVLNHIDCTINLEKRNGATYLLK
jgi:DNA repair exonuclease SbcCD ATPase subunit